MTYGDEGIKVRASVHKGCAPTCCATTTSASARAGVAAVRAGGAVLEPEDVADAVVRTIAAEEFLVLPHPEVLTYWRRKTDDYDRWLRGMRRLQARVTDPA